MRGQSKKRIKNRWNRNLNIKKQLNEVRIVKNKKFKVGAAIGVGLKEIERAEALIEANVDLLVIDTAHGHTKRVFDTLREINKIKKNKTSICAGNIATAEAANFLIKGHSQILPIKSGATIALVFLFILDSIRVSSIQ